MMIGFYNSALRLKLERKNVELADSSERIEHIASFNELTGIFNRRQLRQTIGERIRNIARAGGGLSIVILDLDHFKSVNDRYGHPVGDAVLKAFADIATAVLRSTDTIGRYGGEEFIVVLGSNDVISTRMVAERVRTSTEQVDWSKIAPMLSVTVSAALPPISLERPWMNWLNAPTLRCTARKNQDGIDWSRDKRPTADQAVFRT
jgi:diguanylate cyclase (GGDEF)-like protein